LRWTCDLCGDVPDYCDAYQCPATTEPGDPDVLDAAA
jgi:hypothetical protein